MILADGHVHLHSCFNQVQFFQETWKNFRKSAGSPGIDGTLTPVLFLTECHGVHVFDDLKASILKPMDPSIQVFETEEKNSLGISLNALGTLFLISGRQIVSQEKIEVLAIGSTSDALENKPILQILEANATEGFLSIIPWGFGKWIGSRGIIIHKLITTHSPKSLFFGDNRNRFDLNGKPELLQKAESKGFRMLSGSDPLPIASEQCSAGAFGFKLHDSFLEQKRPFNSICSALSSQDSVIEPFGEFERLHRFIRNQAYMQYLKRMRS